MFDSILGRFTLGSGRKKEKVKVRTIPDMYSKGALVWTVQVSAIVSVFVRGCSCFNSHCLKQSPGIGACKCWGLYVHDVRECKETSK